MQVGYFRQAALFFETVLLCRLCKLASSFVVALCTLFSQKKSKGILLRTAHSTQGFLPFVLRESAGEWRGNVYISGWKERQNALFRFSRYLVVGRSVGIEEKKTQKVVLALRPNVALFSLVRQRKITRL